MLTAEFYLTCRANGWTPATVDSLTLRQFVYGWAMVKIYQDQDQVTAAAAGRAAQAKDTEFTKWLAQMGY